MFVIMLGKKGLIEHKCSLILLSGLTRLSNNIVIICTKRAEDWHVFSKGKTLKKKKLFRFIFEMHIAFFLSTKFAF